MVGLGIVLLVSAATGSYGAGRRGLGGVHGRQRAASRSSRAGCSTGSARRGCSGRRVVASSARRHGAADRGRSRRTGRSATTYVAAAVAGAALPAGRLVRPGPLVARAASSPPSCRPRSRSRRCSTRRSSSSARSWSRCWPRPGTRWPGSRAALVAGVVGTLAFAAQRVDRAARAPARPRRRARGRRCRGGTRGPARPSSAPPWASLFGAAEVTTVAFAEEQGNQALRPASLLALWALGSLIAGVDHRRDPLAARPARTGSAGARSAMALRDGAALLRRLASR